MYLPLHNWPLADVMLSKKYISTEPCCPKFLYRLAQHQLSLKETHVHCMCQKEVARHIRLLHIGILLKKS